MASPAYEQILTVQSLDVAITQLRHRLASHPLRAEAAAAAASVARQTEVEAEIEGRRHELERNLKRLSDEVATIEARRADVDSKLYGGTVNAAKELMALQEEATSLLVRQRGVEDQELDIMERQEELDTELAAARTELTAATDAATSSESALAEAAAEIEGEISQLTDQRAEAVANSVPELLARYEQLAPAFEGVALARVVDGRCDGCHIKLSAVAVDQLAKAADDAAVTCEECGRLLVR